MYNYQNDTKLSAGWKSQFDIYEKYGYLGMKDPVGFKSVPFWKKNSLNFLAFVFGPIYFAIKGMYRVALSILLIVIGIISALVLLDSIFAINISKFWTGTASGVIYGMSANYAYYNYKVKNYRGWNPFLGMGKPTN